MSKLVASYGDQDPKSGVSRELRSLLASEWPELTQAWMGVLDEAGNSVMPPCSLILFPEGDKLKFCLSPKWGDRVAFGVIADPSKGLSGVEQALVDGEIGWKKSPRRSRT